MIEILYKEIKMNNTLLYMTTISTFSILYFMLKKLDEHNRDISVIKEELKKIKGEKK